MSACGSCPDISPEEPKDLQTGNNNHHMGRLALTTVRLTNETGQFKDFISYMQLQQISLSSVLSTPDVKADVSLNTENNSSDRFMKELER